MADELVVNPPDDSQIVEALIALRRSNSLIPLASLVATNEGEGFLIGRSLADPPRYTVLLFNQQITTPHTVTLKDAEPLDHPRLPRGMRPFIEYRRRQVHATKGDDGQTVQI